MANAERATGESNEAAVDTAPFKSRRLRHPEIQLRSFGNAEGSATRSLKESLRRVVAFSNSPWYYMQSERCYTDNYLSTTINQSFSPENFRAIFDYENRRGVYLEGRFFPQIAKLTDRIKAGVADIRGLRKRRGTLSPDTFKEQHSQLNEGLHELQDKKEKMLADELERMSREIAAPGFRVILSEVRLPSGRRAYKINKASAAYFAVKQLQYNVRGLYAVKQNSRYKIVRQLASILGDSFPKYVVRTDIESFYESIVTERLLKKIDSEALLALPSRRMIRQILTEYRTLPGSPTGIPRGVGISAYLSELYMREFDEHIRAHPEIVFYARYVDDMIMVFAPEPNSSVSTLLPFIRAEAAALGLALNTTKTREYDASAAGTFRFEYLGYKITFGLGSIRIGLGTKRKLKYRRRIIRSFEEYKKRVHLDERQAQRLLLRRIRFLTGNTRLQNNKANILVGSFFSNSLISVHAN